ncbi:serine hydrolase domain-containing protein [Streptomyces sp. NPDC048282]|uniref:serine hydrolase domain-containing protein n=1 Tax=Streptomyces sp. NPDC048282 TaxID=3365528 RepID=UPI00371802A6
MAMISAKSALALSVAAIVPAAAPSASARSSPPGPSEPCGRHEEVRRALTALTAHDHIAGASVLADGPCGRWSETAGRADLGTGRPMNTTDRLRVGSVTKTFTATVVLQLAPEHRLSLDTPVAHYLPGTLGDAGKHITVRRLLRHRPFEPRELIARALELPRPQQPWHYATTDYLVLGLIVQQDETRIRGRYSHSYFAAEDGRRVDRTDWNTTFGGVGGALVSTQSDLTRFADALLGGRLLPAPRLREMQRTVAADPDRLWPGARYGLGLISSPLSCGGVWWGHAGTVPGGHRALVAVGPGGRSVAVPLSQVPDTLRAEQYFQDLVDTSLCASERTSA